MTNGEKILKDFKDCEVCEPIVEDDIIHVIFSDKNDSAICFDLSWWNMEYKEPTTKNDLGVDCISRVDALRVAKNEYLRGWHNALCKALSEKYSIHCEEGSFNVIQEETITGLGLSMDCAVGKDVESYMSTIPSVTPQEPILDKIRAEIAELSHYYPMGHDYQIAITRCIAVIDKYKAESESQESEGQDG